MTKFKLKKKTLVPWKKFVNVMIFIKRLVKSLAIINENVQ